MGVDSRPAASGGGNTQRRRVPDVFRLSLRLFLRGAFGAALCTRRTDGQGTSDALKLHERPAECGAGHWPQSVPLEGV